MNTSGPFGMFRLRPAYLFMGLIAIVLIYFIMIGLGRAESEGTPDGSVRPASPSQTTGTGEAPIAQKDPPALDSSVSDLKQNVRRFTRYYFSRSQSQTQAMHQKSIEPYVTDDFMASFYEFEALNEGVERVEARPVGSGTGHIDVPEEGSDELQVAEHAVTISITEYDADGEVLFRGKLLQQMAWVLTPEGWRIHSLM